MKKIFLALFVAATFVACDDSKTTSTTEDKKDSVENKADSIQEKIQDQADTLINKVEQKSDSVKEAIEKKK